MPELASAVDITGPVWPEARPAPTDRRLRQVIEASSDAFVCVDADGRALDLNREAELVFGWRRAEVLGRPISDTLLAPLAAEAEPAIGRFLSTGDAPTVSRRIEMLARHRDGYQFPVELTISPALDGERVSFDLFLRDITDRKQIERRLEETQLEALERLAVAAEYRDEDTGDHTRRVAQLAALIALELGLGHDMACLIQRAAPLHDVGKIAISDAVLYKPGRLTPEEFEVVKRHTTVGAAILAGRDSPLLEVAQQIAIAHHERWDGSGYPYGLAGHAIPLAGRIVSVADVFDALAHRRPYKPAWPREQAIAEIRSQSGRQFDPSVVDAFLHVQVGVRPVEQSPFPATDEEQVACS
jgi:PAS domain S-box-containing protein/putative nucleotidyltransferase with HDIG domain